MAVWQDEYDGIWTLHKGLPAGHDWLLVALSSRQEEVQQVLEGVPEVFKGQLYVLLLPEITATPLEKALQVYHPQGVLVLGRDLVSGPALDLPAKTHESTAGLTYQEGGPYPAWHSALTLEGENLPDLWASTCAKQDVPVVVRSPEHALKTLLQWWKMTPLALQNLQH